MNLYRSTERSEGMPMGPLGKRKYPQERNRSCESLSGDSLATVIRDMVPLVLSSTRHSAKQSFIPFICLFFYRKNCIIKICNRLIY